MAPITKSYPKFRALTFKLWRGSEHIMFFEHGGEPWVTDRFMAMKVDTNLHHMLDLFNLEPTPGLRVEVYQTFRRVQVDDEPVKASEIVAKVESVNQDARRLVLGNDTRKPLLVDKRGSGGGWATELLRPYVLTSGTTSPPVMLSDERCQWIELAWPGGDWFVEGSPVKPASYAVDGTTVAILMPVRV